MSSDKRKRIVETLFSSRNLRGLEKTGITVEEMMGIKQVSPKFSDKIKVRRTRGINVR